MEQMNGRNIMSYIGLRALILYFYTIFGIYTCFKKQEKIKITVFYESYCPYSIDFIVNQLQGTWDQLKDNIILDIVPFGHAQQVYQNGHFKFKCQHGPKECHANKLHACAVYQACGEPGSTRCPTSNVSRVMQFISCTVSGSNQMKAYKTCATKAALDPRTIADCANSELGDRLESKYGNQTNALDHPKINYVPFIMINNNHNETIQIEALDDLKYLICRHISTECREE